MQPFFSHRSAKKRSTRRRRGNIVLWLVVSAAAHAALLSLPAMQRSIPGKSPLAIQLLAPSATTPSDDLRQSASASAPVPPRPAAVPVTTASPPPKSRRPAAVSGDENPLPDDNRETVPLPSPLPMNERQARRESAAAIPMAAPLPISPSVPEAGGVMAQEPPENPRARSEAIPLYDKNPPPAYPRLALVRGWQGEVVLRVRVIADGTVSAVDIEQSSGHAILDRTALDAVRKWRFIPAQRGGAPVAAEVLVPVPFRLQSR